MRLEFDSVVKVITDEDTGERVFRCVNQFQYWELCKILLTPPQWDRHCGLNYDGIYRVSKKRFDQGKEYMKSNIWNK